jgi:hypothetical protein
MREVVLGMSSNGWSVHRAPSPGARKYRTKRAYFFLPFFAPFLAFFAFLAPFFAAIGIPPGYEVS